MYSDTSWYDDSKQHCRNQPSTSEAERGRPPDKEPMEEKPDTKNIIEAVCLVDDEDDPEEAINSFHNLTRKKILLPLTGVEVQDEFKFIEALRQFKMILEERVEVLTLRKNLKEILYKYLLFFGSNYGRITISYKEQYLDVMEDILLFYCDIIKEFFRDQKRRDKKMKIIQEARRIKILFRDCMLKKMDRILHILLKVRLAPEIEEYGLLWGDIYMYFLTKVPYKHTDDDILRGFIAFQKFKTIRAKSESAMIDKLMMGIYKKSPEELRRISCLGEIMDRMKRDRLYTVRDMVTRYTRYYKEISKNGGFAIEDSDDDIDDINMNEMQRLNLSNSFPNIPCISSSNSATAKIFADRRKGIRKTVLDMARESNSQFDQPQTSEFSLFSDDVPKKEAPEDPIVVLDDEEDDDVIVVCDNLKTVITIDDDEEEHVQIQPPKSPPPPREALSPDKIIRPPENDASPSTTQPVENPTPNPVEEMDTTSPENELTPLDSSACILETAVCGNSVVPDTILLSKETVLPKKPLLATKRSDGKIASTFLNRQVKQVENSLKITINSLSSTESIPRLTEEVPPVEAYEKGKPSEQVEAEKLPPENFSDVPTELMKTASSSNQEKRGISQIETSAPVIEKASPSNKPDEIKEPTPSKTADVSSETTSVLPNSDGAIEELSQPKENVVSVEKPTPTVDSSKSIEKLSASTKFSEKLEFKQDVALSKPEESQSEITPPPASPNEPVQELPPKANLAAAGSEKELQAVQPMETEKLQDEVPKQLETPDKAALEPCLVSPSGSVPEPLSEDEDANQTDGEDTAMDVDSSNLTINQEMETTSPVDKENSGENLEDNTDSTLKEPVAKEAAISKIPDDLEVSPDTNPNRNENNVKCERVHTVSETSTFSSPSFESIDKAEVKIYFNGKEQVTTSPSLSGNELDTSVSSTPNTSNSTSISTCETDVKATTTVGCVDSEMVLDSQPILNSSAESSENIPENTTEEDDSMLTEKTHEMHSESNDFPAEPVEVAAPEGESSDLAQKEPRILNEPLNYSTITECYTKFPEELSVEDILTTSTAENLAISTIDLVSSTEDADNVIMVKCRQIEPLKEEDVSVSGAEAVTFSTEEVLTPSEEPIALLVTYPGSSEEYLMCDTNIALSVEQTTFSSEETAPSGDDVTSPRSETSNRTSLETDASALPPRRETVDSVLSLSGSQPYTPITSPSTRVETLRQDTQLNNGTSALDESGVVGHTLESPYQHPIILNGLSKETEGKNTTKAYGIVSKIINNVIKRRKSTESSLKGTSKSLKSRRKSSETSGRNQSATTKNRETNLKPSAVEDFREDLSQSLTSAKRVTPQEVDKISQLPFKYSQQLWSDKSQQKVEVSQTNNAKFNVDKPLPAKPSHQKIVTSQSKHNVLQEKSNVSPQGSNVSQPDTGLPLHQQTLDMSQPKPSVNLTDSQDKSRSANFVEEKMQELYVKEYGNTLQVQDNRMSPAKVQSKRRDSQEALSPARSLKIYSREKPAKNLSQTKDRDLSLKSYKALIKGVSKRRTSFLRDPETTTQKEEATPQPQNRKLKETEDIPQPTEATSQTADYSKESSREANIYDNNDLFNNGIDGPIGKPLGNTDNSDNFFWDTDSDTTKSKEDTFSGTISVKPDSQLYQASKGTNPQKSLVSSLKSSRPKGDNNLEQKSPEKKKVTFANKPEMGLYAESEAVQEKQPNYFDYSFNNFFASQNSLNIPLQPNLISPEIPNSYFPNLNFSNQNPLYFNNDKLQNSQNTVFLPSENLEINPNLLHSEKNVPENFNSEDFSTVSRSLEDASGILEQNYGLENADEMSFLGLSSAFLNGSIYSAANPNSIMFNDNPFIGQNLDNMSTTPTLNSSSSQPEKYIYGAQNLGNLPVMEHATGQALSSPVTTNTRPPSAHTNNNVYKTKNAENIGPNPEQFPATLPPTQMYSDMVLNTHNNLYYDQNAMRLPDISTLKDPRRKNHKTLEQGREANNSNASQSNNFMQSSEIMPPAASPNVTERQNIEFPAVNSQNPLRVQTYDSTPVQNIPVYRQSVENLSTTNSLQQTETPPNPIPTQITSTIPSNSNRKLQTPKVEETVTTETIQDSLQKAQLPPKKRKLTEDEELAIYIQKFKEEKERKKKLEEISYPAQRQMSIADLQHDFPKVKTLAARKLYPEGTGYQDQNYYEYPQGYNDFNDYSNNKRSIMNVYINGLRECSANYPLCLMIGTVHTCVNNQANTAENNQHPETVAQTRPPPPEVPPYTELTPAPQNLQNIQKTLEQEEITRQIVEIPQARPKRSRKTGNCTLEAPPAKRGRGRPRKNVN